MRGTATKGLDSYRIEDGASFYGRDADSERLVSRLLSSRFLLLHARSGAGKTSLLQARATPDLEEEGWSVIISRPGRILQGSSPWHTVQADVVKALVPPPATELSAIDRTCHSLFPGRSAAELTIRDVMAAYQKQREIALTPAAPTGDTAAAVEALRTLQEPVRLTEGKDAEEYYPLFNALLRTGMPPASYLRHLSALCVQPPFNESDEVARETPLGDVVEQLRDAQSGALTLLKVLGAPANSLADFFGKVFLIYGKWRPNLKLALVLDQFEELFTLFGDTGSSPLPEANPDALDEVHTYTLRDEFFAQLKELYRRIGAAGGGVERRSSAPQLPLCCVISTRQEYIADLDPVRAFVSDLDQWSFHLDRLESSIATNVLVEITRHSPWPFSEDLASRITFGLTREGRYVDPAELQVVVGRILQEARQAGDAALPANAGPVAAFEALGRDDTAPLEASQEPGDRERVRNVLSRYFNEFLDKASTSAEAPAERERTRLELLEILQPLITERGKAPAPVDVLIKAPFRNRERRERLLNILEEAHIIRNERRGGILMTEIRHDFLIRPIHRLVLQELKTDQYGGLVSAQAILTYKIGSLPDELQHNLLTEEQFKAVERYRDTLSWDYSDERWRWTPAELMLRTALSLKGIPPQTLKTWADLASMSRRTRPRKASDVCTRESIEAMNSSGERPRFDPDELPSIVRAHLEICRESERGWIEYWAKRWVAAASGRQHV